MDVQMININKVKSIYEIAGAYVWQYGRFQPQYVWDRFKYKNPILVNKNSNEEIKGFKNIISYIKLNDLELESRVC